MANKIAVIGGGAAGLLAAGTAARNGAEVLIIERNARLARKVMITGKGRCNVTNACLDIQEFLLQVPVNGRFLYSAFHAFSPADTMQLFEGEGVPLKTERGNRVFPASDKAVDIVDALVRYARGGNVDYTQARITEFRIEDNRIVSAVSEDGTEIKADRFLICTGGSSYPGTGSTGDGYLLAEQAGHTVIPPKPSLVPLVVHEGWCSDLQGLSLKNTALKLYKKGSDKVVYSDFGEMLFTHFGVSGPMALSASAHVRDIGTQQYELELDLKPALSAEQLDARLQREFSEQANKDFINSLGGLLPNKLIPVIIRLSGIEPRTKVNQITKTQRQALGGLLKGLKLTVTGTRPIEEAIVTSGGVHVKEINPKTMQSKLIENLYFAGEVLDVDAYTGGFNLQIAFSTGYLAGKAAAEEVE